MNRDDFLKRLNRRATLRYGTPTITRNILADWLEAKVIDAPEKHGRERNWSAKEYRKALEIVRLKSQDVSDLSEIRFHLWMKGHCAIFFYDEFRDRNAISRRFVRLRNELTKSIHSTYPEVENTSPDNWPARTIIRNMGELDGSLAKFVQYEPCELLAMYRLVKFGEARISELECPIKQLIESVLYELKICFDVSDEFLKFCTDEVFRISGVFTGLFEKMDISEKSVEWAILRATHKQYELVRQIYRFSVGAFAWLDFRKVSSSLLHPKWRLMAFVLLLHLIFRLEKDSSARAGTDFEVLNLFEANFFA